MGFNLFTETNARLGTEMRISVLKSGSIHLNAACMRAQFKDITFAQLLYDRELRRIAVKPATDKDEQTFTICETGQNVGHLSAKMFLRYYKIPFDKTCSYRAEWLDDPGAFVIRLDDNKSDKKQPGEN